MLDQSLTPRHGKGPSSCQLGNLKPEKHFQGFGYRHCPAHDGKSDGTGPISQESEDLIHVCQSISQCALFHAPDKLGEPAPGDLSAGNLISAMAVPFFDLSPYLGGELWKDANF